MICLILNRIVVKIALLNFNLILVYMKKPIILATFTMILIWWISIYRFGWWGAVGCLTFGIITTLIIEWKR